MIASSSEPFSVPPSECLAARVERGRLVLDARVRLDARGMGGTDGAAARAWTRIRTDGHRSGACVLVHVGDADSYTHYTLRMGVSSRRAADDGTLRSALVWHTVDI